MHCLLWFSAISFPTNSIKLYLIFIERTEIQSGVVWYSFRRFTKFLSLSLHFLNYFVKRKRYRRVRNFQKNHSRNKRIQRRYASWIFFAAIAGWKSEFFIKHFKGCYIFTLRSICILHGNVPRKKKRRLTTSSNWSSCRIFWRIFHVTYLVTRRDWQR